MRGVCDHVVHKLLDLPLARTALDQRIGEKRLVDKLPVTSERRAERAILILNMRPQQLAHVRVHRPGIDRADAVAAEDGVGLHHGLGREIGDLQRAVRDVHVADEAIKSAQGADQQDALLAGRAESDLLLTVCQPFAAGEALSEIRLAPRDRRETELPASDRLRVLQIFRSRHELREVAVARRRDQAEAPEEIELDPVRTVEGALRPVLAGLVVALLEVRGDIVAVDRE